jgi:hypothetical protein
LEKYNVRLTPAWASSTLRPVAKLEETGAALTSSERFDAEEFREVLRRAAEKSARTGAAAEVTFTREDVRVAADEMPGVSAEDVDRAVAEVLARRLAVVVTAPGEKGRVVVEAGNRRFRLTYHQARRNLGMQLGLAGVSFAIAGLSSLPFFPFVVSGCLCLGLLAIGFFQRTVVDLDATGATSATIVQFLGRRRLSQRALPQIPVAMEVAAREGMAISRSGKTSCLAVSFETAPEERLMPGFREATQAWVAARFHEWRGSLLAS